MTTAAQRVHAMRLEEVGLLKKLEEVREQSRTLAASESMLQANLTTLRARLLGVQLGEECAAERAAEARTGEGEKVQ